jgi:hypothetical protein
VKAAMSMSFFMTATLALSAVAADLQPPLTEDQVRESIERGVTFLVGDQNPDG